MSSDPDQDIRSRLYSAQRQFDLATILVATAAYALLFASLQLFRYPVGFAVFAAAFIAMIAFSQAFFFRGKKTSSRISVGRSDLLYRRALSRSASLCAANAACSEQHPNRSHRTIRYVLGIRNRNADRIGIHGCGRSSKTPLSTQTLNAFTQAGRSARQDAAIRTTAATAHTNVAGR